MSCQPIYVRCQTCGISGSSQMLGGCFYLLEDGREMFLESSLGFCDDCDTFAAIENLDIDQSRARLSEVISKQKAVKEEIGKLSSTWLGRKWSYKHLIKKLYGDVEYYDSQIELLKHHVTLCMERAGRPCCLGCGSTGVKTLIIPRMADLEAFEKIDVRMPHLDCSGSVEVSLSRLRMSFPRTPKRYYDLHCNPIS